MKQADALRDLWKKGHFRHHRSVAEVRSLARELHGVGFTNVHARLAEAPFLILEKEGWIERMRYKPDKDSDAPAYFDLLDIHPEIREACEKQFDAGHFDDAVFRAFKRLNNAVKNKSGIDDDGKSLMLRVFNETRPVLKFSECKTTTEKNIQEGNKFLFAGAMMAVRNPNAHDDVIYGDPAIVMQHIALASLLMRALDTSYK